MHVHLSPRHLVLTAAIHAYVANKISHLENQTDHLLAAHIVLMHDDTKTKNNYVVKVHLAVPGPDIYAEDRENNLYAAIDLVMAKLSSQLRKRKTRLITSKKHKAQRAKERKKRGV